MADDGTPIVVTSDGHPVGERSRKAAEAARSAGQKTIPAYVLDVAWETATLGERARLEGLGAVLDEGDGA